ncbi:MAG: DNA-binding NarL/FixJ family response regulator [Crocinitomicaceae bacterium]|jgi:DNA-binding NarL/FixJ family response regulator
MKKKITIGVAEDQRIYRNGLITMLNDSEDYKVTIEAENGMEMLMKMKGNVPDVVLLDYRMPELNGIEVAKKIRQKYEAVKILLLSMFDNQEFVVQAVECGANGYLSKDDAPDEIIKAVDSVLSTGYYLNDRTSKCLIGELVRQGKVVPSFEGVVEFSRVEMQIIKFICEEKSATEIGVLLYRSKRTIDGYRSGIMKKIGAKNVVGIVMYAAKHKLIEM